MVLDLNNEHNFDCAALVGSIFNSDSTSQNLSPEIATYSDYSPKRLSGDPQPEFIKNFHYEELYKLAHLDQVEQIEFLEYMNLTTTNNEYQFKIKKVHIMFMLSHDTRFRLLGYWKAISGNFYDGEMIVDGKSDSNKDQFDFSMINNSNIFNFCPYDQDTYRFTSRWPRLKMDQDSNYMSIQSNYHGWAYFNFSTLKELVAIDNAKRLMGI
jgi:hypothetical protein